MTIAEALEAEGYEPQPDNYEYLYHRAAALCTKLRQAIKEQQEVVEDQRIQIERLTRFHAGAMALCAVAEDFQAMADALRTLEGELQIG